MREDVFSSVSFPELLSQADSHSEEPLVLLKTLSASFTSANKLVHNSEFRKKPMHSRFKHVSGLSDILEVEIVFLKALMPIRDYGQPKRQKQSHAQQNRKRAANQERRIF